MFIYVLVWPFSWQLKKSSLVTWSKLALTNIKLIGACLLVFVAFCSLCIVNDELFVRNATSEEMRCAFAAPAPSNSPVLPTLMASQQEMLSAFSKMSEMNLEWSQKWAESKNHALILAILNYRTRHKSFFLWMMWEILGLGDIRLNTKAAILLFVFCSFTSKEVSYTALAIHYLQMRAPKNEVFFIWKMFNFKIGIIALLFRKEKKTLNFQWRWLYIVTFDVKLTLIWCKILVIPPTPSQYHPNPVGKACVLLSDVCRITHGIFTELLRFSQNSRYESDWPIDRNAISCSVCC